MDKALFPIEQIQPGFTIAIEIDHPLFTMHSARRLRLADRVGPFEAYIDRSALGNTRVVFPVPACGWQQALQTAVLVAGTVAEDLSIAGIEVCRSDLWNTEPFFDHEPDGIGARPQWCFDAVPASHATAAIEVEPQRTPSGRLRSARKLLRASQIRTDARLSKSTAGRPQLIVETRGSLQDATTAVAECASVVAEDWSITRLRAAHSGTYESETSSRTAFSDKTAGTGLPDWQVFTFGDPSRWVVVRDTTTDLSGWSVDVRTIDGVEMTRPLVLDTLWADAGRFPDIDQDGSVVTAWAAIIEFGSHVTAFRNSSGARLCVDPWDSMSAWLVDSLHGQPTGLIIDIGPGDFVPIDDDDQPVVCGQIHVLDDGVFMLRRSKTLLRCLALTDFSVDGLALDTWHFDDHFDDCTDGYLFTRDSRLVARACVTWFRDTNSLDSPDDLGCSHQVPDYLPRVLPWQ